MKEIEHAALTGALFYILFITLELHRSPKIRNACNISVIPFSLFFFFEPFAHAIVSLITATSDVPRSDPPQISVLHHLPISNPPQGKKNEGK